ncbi:unnamed protein product [Periconia digitata]|uniref:Uncharacterized protein n=1 Tax=Periconia digitata TaxID=1303443 RepID=A0A9W4XPS3_9PLEO|nr:unnamed protein product [Periconia digitata]
MPSPRGAFHTLEHDFPSNKRWPARRMLSNIISQIKQRWWRLQCWVGTWSFGLCITTSCNHGAVVCYYTHQCHRRDGCKKSPADRRSHI